MTTVPVPPLDRPSHRFFALLAHAQSDFLRYGHLSSAPKIIRSRVQFLVGACRMISGSERLAFTEEKVFEELCEFFTAETKADIAEEASDLIEAVILLASIRGVSLDAIQSAGAVKERISGPLNSALLWEGEPK